MGSIKALPAKAILSLLIGYLSDVVAALEPDELTEQGKKNLQMGVGVGYAIFKFAGKELAEGTATDIDDKLVAEGIEICEQAAVKYGLELDATAV